MRQWPALPILPGKDLTKGYSKYCGSRRNLSIEEALPFLPRKLCDRQESQPYETSMSSSLLMGGAITAQLVLLFEESKGRCLDIAGSKKPKEHKIPFLHFASLKWIRLKEKNLFPDLWLPESSPIRGFWEGHLHKGCLSHFSFGMRFWLSCIHIRSPFPQHVLQSCTAQSCFLLIMLDMKFFLSCLIRFFHFLKKFGVKEHRVMYAFSIWPVKVGGVQRIVTLFKDRSQISLEKLRLA